MLGACFLEAVAVVVCLEFFEELLFGASHDGSASFDVVGEMPPNFIFRVADQLSVLFAQRQILEIVQFREYRCPLEFCNSGDEYKTKGSVRRFDDTVTRIFQILLKPPSHELMIA